MPTKTCACLWCAHMPTNTWGCHSTADLDGSVVSVGQGNGQWLPGRTGEGAARRREPVHQAAHDADQECADPEDHPARAEWDVKCHDFGPFAWWRVMGATSRVGSSPARTGAPWRPSQMLLRPANR